MTFLTVFDEDLGSICNVCDKREACSEVCFDNRTAIRILGRQYQNLYKEVRYEDYCFFQLEYCR